MMIEKMDASTKAMLANLKMMNTNQAKTDVELEESSEAIEETRVEREEPTSADRTACQETTVCHEETEAAIEKIEPDSVTMQSVAEHREAPEEDAVVKPVRGRKKRHRGPKQAAGRRGEPKELTRGDCGSRKKLAAACRKVSRRATVAWRKRNVFRKFWAQANCGPRHELAAGRNMTRHAGVARREGNFVSKYSTRDNIAPRTRTGQTEENRRCEVPECKKGIGSRVVEEPLYQRKGRNTPTVREG
jgi:hypothetical protein